MFQGAMSCMFKKATAFNQSLDTWNVSKVTYMDGMFQGATSFNQPLAQWDIKQVITIDRMFYGASNFNQTFSTPTAITRVPNKTEAVQGAAIAKLT